jgi:hypothetical protein
MAIEEPASQPLSAEEKFAQKALRKSKQLDLDALERRVHIAELRAREAEAEIRFMEASEKRKHLKTADKERTREKRGRRKNKKSAREASES